MLLAEHDRRLERLLLGVNVLGEPDHVTSNQRARVTSVMRVLLRLGVVNEPALRAAAAAFPEWSALMYKLRSAPSDARALQELSFASWWSRLHEQVCVCGWVGGLVGVGGGGQRGTVGSEPG